MDLIFLILSTVRKCVPFKSPPLKPGLSVVVLVMTAGLFKDFLELFNGGLIFSFSFSLSLFLFLEAGGRGRAVRWGGVWKY